MRRLSVSLKAPSFLAPNDQDVWQKVRGQMDAIRRRIGAIRYRRDLMRRLFGDPASASDDARRFFLMLADLAEMGATEIAESDRAETARAANRALVNRLIDAWDGDAETLMKLRARERELTEEEE